MSDPFQSIRESCKAIDNAKFNGSGIFTNAILSRPEVTTLIRDALPAEQGLYKISRNSGLTSSMVRDPLAESTKPSFTDLNPERIDGKTFYSAPDPSQKTNNAVAIPQLFQTSTISEPNLDGSSSPSRRRTSLNHKLVSEEITQSEDVNTLCQALISILEQYPSSQPNANSKSDIIALQNELQLINEDVLALEREVVEQSLKLDRHNEVLNELSPRRGNFSPKKTLSASEMITREELEIAELERELEKRSMT